MGERLPKGSTSQVRILFAALPRPIPIGGHVPANIERSLLAGLFLQGKDINTINYMLYVEVET